MKNTWSKSDINYLKKLYPIVTDMDKLAFHLNRTKNAVKQKAEKLGMRRENHVQHKFTLEEDRYLIDNYENTRTDEIARHLGLKLHVIYNRAYNLGLKKSEAFLKSPESGILYPGHTRGKSTQFKKGQVPPNKGKKQSPELREKCRHTDRKSVV